MITLTERAAGHVSRYMTRRGRGVGIRFGVKTSGCNGLSYTLEFVDTPNKDDLVFESYGVSVFTDPRSLPYIDGTELDYVLEGLQEGFRYNNPNLKSECGCGESFAI